MYKSILFALSVLFLFSITMTAQDLAGAIEGTVKKVDAATKTFVVKAADGTDRTFHIADNTAVHGAGAAARDTRDTLRGLGEGSQVVVHYAKKGTEDTAEEVDHIGKGGLKVGDGVLKSLDRNARTLTLKGADGTEETYRLSERAARDAGKDIGKAGERSERVTVYYTEEGGSRVIHFFKKVF